MSRLVDLGYFVSQQRTVRIFCPKEPDECVVSDGLDRPRAAILYDREASRMLSSCKQVLFHDFHDYTFKRRHNDY